MKSRTLSIGAAMLLALAGLAWLLLSPAAASRDAARAIRSVDIPPGWEESELSPNELHVNRLGWCLNIPADVPCGGASRLLFAPDPTEEQLRDLLQQVDASGTVVGPNDGCEPPVGVETTAIGRYCTMRLRDRPGFTIARGADLTSTGRGGGVPDGMVSVLLRGFEQLPSDG